MNMFTALQHAAFNTWANGHLYAACAQVGEPAIHADRGAFFHSIFGTLNHILLVDTLYMTVCRASRVPSRRSTTF